MTLIIGIFTRDIHDKEEIFFASDGLAVTYKNNKKIGQDEDVEKIRKLTPKICMGYAGKNSELFEDVYDELKKKNARDICKNSYSGYCNTRFIKQKINDFLNKVHIENKYRELTSIEKKFLRKKIISKEIYKGFGPGDLDIICLFNNNKFSKVVSRDMAVIKILLGKNNISWYWPPCILIELEKKNYLSKIK